MLYVEHNPGPPLAGLVRTLWYARAGAAAHQHERVLPSGRVQVILNLAREFLLDCPEDAPAQPMPPALVMGARSIYEIVDRTDMADLIGIVFEAGAFSLFARDAVDRFTNSAVPLEDVWGASACVLRDQLREVHIPRARLQCLQAFLVDRFAAHIARRGPRRCTEVEFALRSMARAPGLTTVKEIARRTGWSERRFSQVFREEVGLTPKIWCRVQRFQRAVLELHQGADVRWAELALDCGFYDQSHFANEFRAFSGVDATTYSARRTLWANHIPVE